MSLKEKILEYAPIALAVLMGACAIWLTGVNNADFSDSADYLAAARMILEQGRYPDVGSLSFFRAPLYPLFISGIWTLFPGSILAIKVIQVLLHALSAWLIFKTALRITENRFLAATGAVLFAANPMIFYMSAAIQTEALHIFLLVGGIYFLVDMLLAERVKIASGLAFGAAFGLAALCKPSALGVGIVLSIVFAVLRSRRTGAIAAAALASVAMFMVILPWSFYNLSTKGEFILINDASGFALWSGNLPQSLEMYERKFDTPAEALAFADYLGKDVAQAQIEEWERTVGYRDLSFKQREALWQAKAIENMSADPSVAARLFGWKLLNFWKPYVSSNIYSMKRTIVTAFAMTLFYILGLIGLIKIWRDPAKRDVAWMFLGLALTVTVIHVVVVSTMRLRIPYVDTFLMIFAGIGLGSIVLKFVPMLGLSASGGKIDRGNDLELVSEQRVYG